MRIEITKAAAAELILGKLAEGRVTGGAYYMHKTSSFARWAITKDQRCAIGWLYTKEEAKRLQADKSNVYPMAEQLLSTGKLVVDDPAWFATAQDIADRCHQLVDLNYLLGNHCRRALPTMGYDIGNRRSDPVYA